jgi:predicted thioesterase
MRTVFKAGDEKRFVRTVRSEDTARFDSGEVHPVYGTFAVARDAEWACRLFVLEMLEAGEEGVGTFVSVEHLSPALVGMDVEFVAKLECILENEIVCTYEARVGERPVARGRQVQRIIELDRFRKKIKQLE